MRRVFIIIIFTLATALFAQGQASDAKTTRGSIEQELIQLKRNWGKAYVQRDIALLERIIADEYSVTDANGHTTNRAEIVADFKSADAVYEATSYDDVKVKVYGDVAIVAGRGTVKGRSKNGNFHTQYYSTNIFVKRDGRWQAVATHISGAKSL